MDCIRKIERQLYPNPIASIDTYPPVAKEEQEILRNETNLLSGGVRLCSAYIRKKDNDWYIDVYVYMGDKMERLVIVPGHMMSEADEERLTDRFFWWNVVYDKDTCTDFTKVLNRIFPEINIKDYDDFWHTLLHAYFSLHCSGIREKLYKMGLGKVARCVNCAEFNVMGSNVLSALGLPVNMLRKLNTGWAVLTIVCDSKERQRAVNIYKRYHSLMNTVVQLSEMQYRYLIDCYEMDETPDTGILRHLEGVEDDYFDCEIDLYEEFMDYQKGRLATAKCKKTFPKYPDLSETGEFLELVHWMDEYARDGNRIDKKIYELSIRWKNLYLFEDEQFTIRVPVHLKDILREEGQMHIGLYGCISAILREEAVVLFVRRKENPYKPYVTVEIRNGEIYRARQAWNEPITEEQGHFLQRYTVCKGMI